MVVMGQVLAPFGVRGWLRVLPYSARPDSLLGHRVWWIGADGHWSEMEVLEAAVHGKALVARIAGLDDRDAAFALKGRQVAVPREALPAAGTGEYYWQDLIGLTVENAAGAPLGRVRELLATGANDVLVVDGERERLIPFVAAYVLDVDLAAGRLRVDWDVAW